MVEMMIFVMVFGGFINLTLCYPVNDKELRRGATPNNSWICEVERFARVRFCGVARFFYYHNPELTFHYIVLNPIPAKVL